MKKIRVLHIIDTTGPGGAEKVICDIVKKLDRRKFISFLIIPDKGWLYSQLKDKNVTIDIIDGKGAYNASYIIKLIRYVYRNKIDIIHAHLLGVSLYCSFVSLLTGTPLICTIHGFVDLPKRKSKLKIWIISKITKKIIFVSAHLRSYFNDIVSFDNKRTEIIHNGIDNKLYLESGCDDLRWEYGFSKDDIIIGAVGNVTPSKGYDVLIKAASIICNSNPKVKFLIAGEKRGLLYENLKDMCMTLKLNSNILFVGYRTRIASFLKGLDIFILPSISEGFSLSTIEAMAAGLPILATRSGGPEEIIDDQVNGLLVDTNDPVALAEKISIIISNTSLRDKISNKAREIVQDKFSVDLMVAKYEDIYNNVTYARIHRCCPLITKLYHDL